MPETGAYLQTLSVCVCRGHHAKTLPYACVADALGRARARGRHPCLGAIGACRRGVSALRGLATVAHRTMPPPGSIAHAGRLTAMRVVEPNRPRAVDWRHGGEEKHGGEETGAAHDPCFISGSAATIPAAITWSPWQSLRDANVQPVVTRCSSTEPFRCSGRSARPSSRLKARPCGSSPAAAGEPKPRSRRTPASARNRGVRLRQCHRRQPFSLFAPIPFHLKSKFTKR